MSCVLFSELFTAVQNGDPIFREDNEALVNNFGVYIPRTIFDLTFFIIVTTVGLNIVFGIIVDTFSELRDERVGVLVYVRMCMFSSEYSYCVHTYISCGPECAYVYVYVYVYICVCSLYIRKCLYIHMCSYCLRK